MNIVRMVLALILLTSITVPAWADAVDKPATTVRMWAVTTSTTAAIKNFTSSAGGAGGGTTKNVRSCHVKVIHDGGAGSPDIYVSFKNTSADIVAPTDGGEVFTLKAQESLGFDGEFWRVRYLSASGTPAMRIIGTFTEQ